MPLEWKLKSFDTLLNKELYAILRLRNDVFIVEQNCVYPDIDGKDFKAYHLTAWQGDELVAYCRLIPQGISYPEASIGRVLTNPAFRGGKHGRQLMERAISETLRLFQTDSIRIGAQLYLKNFYGSLGFEPEFTAKR